MWCNADMKQVVAWDAALALAQEKYVDGLGSC